MEHLFMQINISHSIIKNIELVIWEEYTLINTFLSVILKYIKETLKYYIIKWVTSVN